VKICEEMASSTQAVPEKLVALGLSSVHLPAKDLINRQVWRRMEGRRWYPLDKDNIEIPEDMAQLNNKNIVKFNFFINNKQVLGFSTKELMRLLTHSYIVISDGTFFIMPEPFTQLYVMYCLKDGFHFPGVFILSREKCQNIYRNFQQNKRIFL